MVGSLGFAVFVKDFAGDVTRVVGAAAQAVLVFGGAFEVMGEGCDFEGDLSGVGAGRNAGAGCFEMRGVAAVDSGAVSFANIGALPVEAVGVDDFKEVFDAVRDLDLIGVEGDAHAFGIAVVGAVEGWSGAIGAARLGGKHPGKMTHELLYAPKTAAR